MWIDLLLSPNTVLSGINSQKHFEKNIEQVQVLCIGFDNDDDDNGKMMDKSFRKSCIIEIIEDSLISIRYYKIHKYIFSLDNVSNI